MDGFSVTSYGPGAFMWKVACECLIFFCPHWRAHGQHGATSNIKTLFGRASFLKILDMGIRKFYPARVMSALGVFTYFVDLVN